MGRPGRVFQQMADVPAIPAGFWRGGGNEDGRIGRDGPARRGRLQSVKLQPPFLRGPYRPRPSEVVWGRGRAAVGVIELTVLS